jgi:phosphate starvation-inducible PhoH-like protein
VKSGLKDALEVLDGLPNISVTRFNEADVMRHDLVSRIVQAYDHRDRQISLKLEDE